MAIKMVHVCMYVLNSEQYLFYGVPHIPNFS